MPAQKLHVTEASTIEPEHAVVDCGDFMMSWINQLFNACDSMKSTGRMIQSRQLSC
jgi:hypothetical protein